jgi:hypothetical protein
LLHDLPVIQDDDAPGNVTHDVKVVADEEIAEREFGLQL